MLNQLLQETKSQVKAGQNWVISPLGFEILFKLLIPMIHGKTKEELISLVGEESAQILLDQLELEKHNGADGKKQFDFDQSFQYAKHLGLDFKNVEEYQKNYEKYLPHLRWNYQDIDDPSSRIQFKIINELYFAHNWKGFGNMEEGLIFHAQDGKEYRVKSFSGESGLRFSPKHYRDDLLEAVQIHLDNPDFCVEFYKPKDLNQFLDAIDEEQLNFYHKSFAKVESIEVVIPEFIINYSLDINRNRNYLGLKQFFEWSEDLNFLLNTKNGARVDFCYQDTTIEFNELGIKGYAKTVFGGITGLYRPKKMEHILFELDHPFFFLIRHKSDTVLFMGTYQIPQEEEELKLSKEKLKDAFDNKLIRQFKPILIQFTKEEKIFFMLYCIDTYLIGEKLEECFWIKEILEDIYTYLQEPNQELLDKIVQCRFYSELTGFEVNNIYFEPQIALKYHSKEQWLCNSLNEIVMVWYHEFHNLEYDTYLERNFYNHLDYRTINEKIVQVTKELLQKDFSNKNILQEFKNIKKLIT
ncbi:MAG: hypothetical protein MK212_09710 [Saprospiraceae bacterium]|nr:hypothetical protein [Saprospiraceae bacterium]